MTVVSNQKCCASAWHGYQDSKIATGATVVVAVAAIVLAILATRGKLSLGSCGAPILYTVGGISSALLLCKVAKCAKQHWPHTESIVKDPSLTLLDGSEVHGQGD